jgi:adenine-specific DNA-methyltransferase
MAIDALRQRLSGAYYTPSDAAGFMAAWVMRGQPSVVLEPSFGDGVFIRAVRGAAADAGLGVAVAGVEKSREAYESFGPWLEADKPIQADFHRVRPFPVDAVIGNPPFVRFRHLVKGEAQAAVAAGESAIGEPVDSAGSTWLTFAVHAASFVRPGGRLALVLPADALYVRYARPFWRFMTSRFGGLRVIRCRERIFDDLLQDVVILLADRAGETTDAVHVELHETRSAIKDEAPGSLAAVPVADILAGGKPFTAALLGGRATAVLARMADRITRIDSLVKFNIGYVDGNKGFFHPAPPTVTEFDLPAASLKPALRSGRYWTFSGAYTSRLPATSQTLLWLPDPAALSPGEQKYVAFGEEQRVHRGFKTGQRSPWWGVPGVKIPDIVVPVFGSLPKMMLNDGGFAVSNSIMAAFWRATPRPAQLLACWYTSMTRLGIELAVHSLGGGVLVLVPRECDAILIPRLPAAPPSDAVLDRIDQTLTAGDVAAAYTAGDAYLVANGWRRRDLDEARKLAGELQAWREER